MVCGRRSSVWGSICRAEIREFRSCTEILEEFGEIWLLGGLVKTINELFE
jgi:hypothetical protein